MSARERWRMGLRLLLAAAFLFAGYKHVADPQMFERIVPGWVPYPHPTVIATGLCEGAGAVGLLIQRLRRLSGAMLALYTVCVFPANIDHALYHHDYGIGGLGWWYHAPRLAFQPVIVWWCLFAGGVIDWPFSPSPLQGRGSGRGGVAHHGRRA